MSDFQMKKRPKKPVEEGQLVQHLGGNYVCWEWVKEQAEVFKKKYPHLMDIDIELQYDYDTDSYSGEGMMLTAAGKPREVYEKEWKQYKKELAEYKQWQKDNAEAIALFKVAENKQIAENKLKRRQAKLLKELEAVEGKLKGK